MRDRARLMFTERVWVWVRVSVRVMVRERITVRVRVRTFRGRRSTRLLR